MRASQRDKVAIIINMVETMVVRVEHAEAE